MAADQEREVDLDGLDALGALQLGASLLEQDKYDRAVEVLQRCVEGPQPDKAIHRKCYGVLAFAATFTRKHRGRAREYLDTFLALPPTDDSPRMLALDANLEGTIRYDLEDDRGAQRAFHRVIKLLQPLDEGAETDPELSLELAEAYLALADLELHAGKTAAAMKHGNAARALCRRVGDADHEPYLEETEWGTMMSPESPNAIRARECDGEVYAIEAQVRTKRNQRKAALAAVDACLERLEPDGYYSSDASSRCSEFAAHWALQGDDIEHARAAAKRHIAVLEDFDSYSPRVFKERAAIHAAIGEYERRSGSPESARQQLARAQELTERAERARADR